MKRIAFTLAEVLITLGIIGIVASMTIPTLIANSQKQQYVTGMKKAYTQFNQVLIKLAADNGCTGDLRCTGLFTDDADGSKPGAAIAKYFRVVKDCGIAKGKGCVAVMNNHFDGTGSNISADNDPYGIFYKFITADGMYIGVNDTNSNCASEDDATAKNNMTQVCGYVSFDVNGLKGPNRYGRDISTFFITNGKGPILYPFGGQDDNHGGSGRWQDLYCGTGSSGAVAQSFCMGRIMEEGWQMNY